MIGERDDTSLLLCHRHWDHLRGTSRLSGFGLITCRNAGTTAGGAIVVFAACSNLLMLHRRAVYCCNLSADLLLCKNRV